MEESSSYSLFTIYYSLVARERDDGVEARRLEGRVDAGDEADDAGEADCQNDVDDGDGHGDRRQRRDEPAHAGRQQQAEHAAERAQERRLDQELQENLFAARAQSLAQPDLERALGDGDEH